MPYIVYSGQVSSGIVLSDDYMRSEMCIESGGVANSTTMNGGRLFVSSGGVANSTTVNAGWMVVYSGGVATSTTVNSGGSLYVSSGGVATSTTVNSGGSLYVSSGGTALNVVWTPCVGNVGVFDGAVVTFASDYRGVYFGSANTLLSSALTMTGMTLSGHSMYVMNGGVANSTTVNDGRLYVSSGGAANSTTVNGYGYLYVSSGGAANSTTVNGYGELFVCSGGVANVLTLAQGFLYVSSGGVANSITAKYCELWIDGTVNNITVRNGCILTVCEGGVARNTVVSSNLWVQSGGKITGELTISNGHVNADDGSIIDFDISTVAPGSKARVNNLSLIGDAPDFTITISATQENGTYALAGGAADFNKTITVITDTGDELGALSVGKKLTSGGRTYSLALKSGTLSLTVGGGGTVVPIVDTGVAAVDVQVGGDLGRNGNLEDDYTVALDHPGWYTITGDFGILNGSVTIVQGKKTVASGTVKNGVLTFNKGKDVLLDSANEYAIVVKNTDKGKTASEYTFTLEAKTLFTDGDNSDDWTDVKTAGPDGLVGYVGPIYEPGVVIADEWVGYGDAVDYKEFTLDKAAKFTFDVTATDATKFTVYALESKTDKKGTTYNLKSKLSTALSQAKGAENYSVTTKELLLEGGTYYFAVESTNAAKGGDADYTVAVNGKSVFYTKGDNSDDWTDVKTAGPDGLVGYVGPIYEPGVVIGGEWVGYGDAVDYKEFTLDTAAKLTFDVTATDATKFTVYALESKTDKKGTTYSLKSKLSTSLSKPKNAVEFSVTTKELLLEAGTYYIAVESTNAKKGGSADYTVAVDGKSVFYTKGDNSDDLWDAAPAFAATDDWHDWVGFGDRIDYRALATDANGGFYDFALSGVTENVKLTVYRVEGKTDKNGVTTYSLKSVKSVTATAKKPTISTGDLCFAADTRYVVAVEAPDAAKAKNSDYTVKMTEKAVFVNRGNESWEDAVAPTEGFDGVLTTAAGGDKFDYFDLADVDRLLLDMTQGKVKVSFYGADQKAVKVAEMTMADGSVKKNVSGLTLEAGHKTNDSFTLADVGDAVKYLKIEAATGNLNTYTFSLIA